MAVYYFASDGLYRFLPEEDGQQKVDSADYRTWLTSTGIPWMGQASEILLVTWDKEKMSSRNSAVYEAGAILYNVKLMGRIMDWPVFWSLASDSSVLADSAGLFSGKTPLMWLGMGVNESAADSQPGLKDGVYAGEINNWPEIKVEVTIGQGRIQKIHFLDDRGTPAFTERMKAVLPQRIVQAGHTDVDGVSGATLSSDNLKKAVNNALNKAR